MSDQPPASQNGGEPDARRTPIQITQSLDTPAREPATPQPLQQVEKQMTGFEKATLRWAQLAVGMSAVAALFVCLQWHEMHTGARDTHDLAVAAKTQAEKMQDMSTAADKIRDAAQQMVTQEQRIADNAQKSLTASIAASQLDQRAWVYLKQGEVLGQSLRLAPWFQPLIVRLNYVNGGRTPASGLFTYKWSDYLTEVEAQKEIIPKLRNAEAQPIAEGPIIVPTFSGNPGNFTDVPVPPDSQRTIEFANGTRRLYVFGVIVYRDIFGRGRYSEYCQYFGVKDVNIPGEPTQSTGHWCRFANRFRWEERN